MSPIGRQPRVVSSPQFDHIDRRLALMVLGLISALMAILFVVGSLLYVQGVRAERQRLTRVIGRVLTPTLERFKTSGTYKMRELAEELVRDSDAIAYIRVLDSEHGTFVSVGPQSEEVAAADDNIFGRVHEPNSPSIVGEYIVNDLPVTEVAYALRGGYKDSWVGAVRVGVWGEPAGQIVLRAGVLIGGLLILLLLLAWPVVIIMSRRIGAPIKVLAEDFEGVMLHAPVHITIEDAQGRIEKASQAFRTAFDVAPGGRPNAADLLPEEVLKANLSDRPEVLMTVGGEDRVFLSSRFPVAFSPTGEVLRSGVVSTDVTVWREDQRQRDQLVAAVENIDDQLLVVVPSRGIIYANPSFCKQTGHSLESLLGQSPAIILSSEEAVGDETGRSQDALLAAFAENAAWRGRIMAERRDGKRYECDLIVSSIVDESGDIHGQVWVGRDVSREVQLQNQLRQSQKMEAVGRLAGGVAHDFNNLLTVINGMSELLAYDLSGEQFTHINMICDAGRRAADLTRQLLAFSRRQVLNIRPLPLNDVVESTMSLLERLIGSEVQLTFEPGTGLWLTEGDIGQMEQVLMNLVINARDAMPDGGTLTVRTENATFDGITEMDGTEVADGNYVVLIVADSGSGMTPEVVQRIFEPFYTTKETGKGTGLGLATVHGIVHQSGGHLWVFSEPGIGTTFRIAFPQVEAETETLDMGAKQPPGGTGESILLVEDDEAVRTVLVRMLSRAGYDVETADDGQYALEYLEGVETAPDLIITDIIMPRLGGVKLARIIRDRSPEQRMIFLSGYSPNLIDLGPGFVEAELLQKPPRALQLLELVRRTLDALPRSSQPSKLA